MKIASGIIVQDKITGKKGVVVEDNYGCCTQDEVPVIFEDTEAFEGIDVKDLKILGPENAVADLKKCGAGKGEECCIFLSIGSPGCGCQRFKSLRDYFISQANSEQLNAKRRPTKLYPHCLLKAKK